MINKPVTSTKSEYVAMVSTIDLKSFEKAKNEKDEEDMSRRRETQYIVSKSTNV